MPNKKIFQKDQSPAGILRQMTVAEKVGQLWMAHGFRAVSKADGSSMLTDWLPALNPTGFPGGLWALMRSDAWTGRTLQTGPGKRDCAAAVNLVQHYAIENTRLGIPLLLAEECPHGLMAIDATTFPVGLALAASWDPSRISEITEHVGRELMERGAHIAFGPVLDLGRDPRWGRCEENFGEDVCLGSVLGAAAVEGFKQAGKCICTLKHFAAYGVPEGGRNAGSAMIGERTLHNVHLPPFEAAVRAGAQAVMSSYNDIDGVPATGDARLLNDILRQTWGFNGIVISDSSAVPDLKDAHRVAATYAEASAMALRAGVDMDLCPDHRVGYRRSLADALDRGLITLDDLDAAVLRVLQMKFDLGLFDHPYVDEGAVELRDRRCGRIQLARQAAAESIVLLKNKMETLPLSALVRRIALVGPNSDDVYNQLGDYTAPQRPGKTLTIRAALEAEAGIELLYARGCSVKDPSTDGFAEAVRCAGEADVVIAVMGGSSKREYGAEFADAGQAVVSDQTDMQDMDCGESVDRATLELPGVQNELLAELKKTGTPLITVLIHGRAMAVSHAAELSDALLTCFYPGEQGGPALCDVLFGRLPPAGRLPVTFPRNAGQIPVHYAKAGSAPACYVDTEAGPLFPFGYGLSYTEFSMEAVAVFPECMPLADLEQGAQFNVSVAVRNTGSRDGVETVQLYLHDEAASVVRPFRELKAFAKIRLTAGTGGRVELKLGRDHLKYWNGTWRVDPGNFRVFAAKHAGDDGISAAFEVMD